MKIPNRLIPLIQADLIEDVLGQLQSGKEAEVYLVLAQGIVRCAKVYKDANNRTFKQRTQYTEGRKTRNSRNSRAMGRNSKFGRKEAEAEWQNTEVDALYLLDAAGVRVPKPLEFYEGVLLLEMIENEDGNPAPRLNDVDFTADQAREYFQIIVRQIVKMLCAGIVHGDLSEFNILLSRDGLVIIDLPQAVQATANNAFFIFERDLVQLAAFFGRVAPEILKTNYAKEIWKLYQRGELKPDSELSGVFVETKKHVNINEVLEEIEAARDDAIEKRGQKYD